MTREDNMREMTKIVWEARILVVRMIVLFGAAMLCIPAMMIVPGLGDHLVDRMRTHANRMQVLRLKMEVLDRRMG